MTDKEFEPAISQSSKRIVPFLASDACERLSKASIWLDQLQNDHHNQVRGHEGMHEGKGHKLFIFINLVVWKQGVFL